ncbi:MAG: hypothetical protein KGL39_05430 [Patescibacteria group bacterium]|nr:hypothetical protein [Patescibacteria group bacterium]
MGDPVYWRLLYPDGTELTEPAENLSIRAARPGAKSLVLLSPDLRPVVGIELNGYRPIFYRQRSMDVNGKGRRLDATIFGRARYDDSGKIDGTLWVWAGNHEAPCPLRLIDSKMIGLQVEA